MIEDSKKVLIVDDDEGIRVMVERVLRREHFEVDTARDGFEAIEKLAHNDYKAILLDLMMPRVDGLDVLRFLQEQRPDLEPAVIVMTADSPRAAEAAKLRNASRFLTKPFDLGDLLAEIRGSARSRMA
ncbi:MAG TPA: response regulator [Thermoanaerobaculia bacterium]